MIHVVDDHLAAAKRPLLKSMFADRKRLFVDLFGWDVPVVGAACCFDPALPDERASYARDALRSPVPAGGAG
jgi:hypothetical protein